MSEVQERKASTSTTGPDLATPDPGEIQQHIREILELLTDADFTAQPASDRMLQALQELDTVIAHVREAFQGQAQMESNLEVQPRPAGAVDVFLQQWTAREDVDAIMKAWAK